MNGDNVVVKDNRVSEIMSPNITQPGSTARGIWAENSVRAQVVGNQISEGKAPAEIGIDATSGSSTVRDNLISGFQAIGVRVIAGSVYSGNVVLDAATPYSGGTAHGTTNFP